MFLVKIQPNNTSHDKKYLNRFSVVGLFLAGFLMIIIILENILEFPHWAHFLVVALLLILLSSPLIFAVEATNEERDINDDYTELLPNSTSTDIIQVTEVNIDIVEATQSLNFWLLFIAMSCGMGSGLATINNVSQIGQSLGYNMVKTNTLVSLWSIWNFLGRFGAGYISDALLHQYGWARPLMIAITLATMTLGHLVIALGFAGNLYIGTILVGICYGAQWGLMPTVTSEIFGVLHMGTIYNTIGAASPMGTYILSVWVIGNIYDKEAGEDSSCYGVHCFMSSFLILASASFFGFLVALTLFFRTKAFYRDVVLRKLRFL